MLDELITVIERKIISLKATIDYNKKYYDYPFTINTDHYYKLMLLHNRLESWENFRGVLYSFRNSRCKPLNKRSESFKKLLENGVNWIPSDHMINTQKAMVEYMKQLEWKIDELNGMWNSFKNECS